MEKELNIQALDKLTEAVKEYETTSGNKVVDMHIRAKEISDPMTEEQPVGAMFPEEQEYCETPCTRCNASDKMMDDCELLNRSIREKVVEPILTLFPISTVNTQQIIDEFALPKNQQNFMTEVRDHNYLMAQTVGQIAYATTAMLLEYQTQCMANHEMCRIVDKNGVPAYVAPNYDTNEFDDEIMMIK